MKSYEEIRESVSNRIKIDCLAYIGDEEGESRVNEIIEYFRQCTLHPDVSLIYTQAMRHYPKPAVENWDDFSDFLIERLLPMANVSFIP